MYELMETHESIIFHSPSFGKLGDMEKCFAVNYSDMEECFAVNNALDEGTRKRASWMQVLIAYSPLKYPLSNVQFSFVQG